MTWLSDSPAYTVITCPRCPHEQVIATWKLYSLFRDKGMDEPDPGKMRCKRCGAKGAVLTGRG